MPSERDRKLGRLQPANAGEEFRRVEALKRLAEKTGDINLFLKADKLTPTTPASTVARVARQVERALRKPVQPVDVAELGQALERLQEYKAKQEEPKRLRESLERAERQRAKREHQERRAELQRNQLQQDERDRFLTDGPDYRGTRLRKSLEAKGWKFQPPPEEPRPYVSPPMVEKERPLSTVGLYDLDGFATVPEGRVLAVLRAAAVPTYVVNGDCRIDVADRERAEQALAEEIARRRNAAVVAKEKARRDAERREEKRQRDWMTLDEMTQRSGLGLVELRKKIAWFGPEIKTIPGTQDVRGVARKDAERLLEMWARTGHDNYRHD